MIFKQVGRPISRDFMVKVAQMKLVIEYVSWGDHLKIGHPEIDRDHELLFAAVNNYISSVNKRGGLNVLGKIIEHIKGYASNHFDREEDFMIASLYSGYAIHKSLHDLFRGVLADFYEEELRGVDISNEIAFFLRNWLVNHVSQIDMEFGRYLKETNQV